ncbi:probable aminopeptidase NPEPL1 isoform X2 [Anguilla rostrata]|uniref:probable aminopeptidase NPEPL1 isoform X2 n=1 Tax=Anguilla rostrata TaxID=7938 RepID=UPI0030CB5C75
MAAVDLVFCQGDSGNDQADRTVLIVGQLSHLQSLAWSDVRDVLLPRVDNETWKTALNSLKPNPTDKCPLWLNLVTVAALPSKVSRHNTPSSAHSLTRLVQTCFSGKRNGHIVVVCEKTSVFALACAIARAFPLFSRLSGHIALDSGYRVTAEFVCVEPNKEPLDTATLMCLSRVAESIRLAARIVDSPCSEMDTEQFLQEVRAVGSELRITPVIFRGEELRKRGFGGIYRVGSAAATPPALAILSYTPSTATQTIAWVGKGIVYDTGGLLIKGKTAMPGMKRYCAGAAAVLGAFRAAVLQGFKENLHAIFCLAENSVGPKATRPDDILRLYSGKTVEIRSTDAGGRLLLADGVAYASRDLKADIILDMATLTGYRDRQVPRGAADQSRGVGEGVRGRGPQQRRPRPAAGLLPRAALQIAVRPRVPAGACLSGLSSGSTGQGRGFMWTWSSLHTVESELQGMGWPCCWLSSGGRQTTPSYSWCPPWVQTWTDPWKTATLPVAAQSARSSSSHCAAWQHKSSTLRLLHTSDGDFLQNVPVTKEGCCGMPRYLNACVNRAFIKYVLNCLFLQNHVCMKFCVLSTI